MRVGSIVRIDDAAFRRLPVERCDVVSGDRSPEGVFRISLMVQRSTQANRPSMRGRYHLIAIDRWCCILFREEGPPHPLPTRSLSQNRNQILRTGQNKDIRFIGVLILRETFFGFSRDGWEREIPAKTEWPIACAGVIGERQLRTKPRSTW